MYLYMRSPNHEDSKYSLFRKISQPTIAAAQKEKIPLQESDKRAGRITGARYNCKTTTV